MKNNAGHPIQPNNSPKQMLKINMSPSRFSRQKHEVVHNHSRCLCMRKVSRFHSRYLDFGRGPPVHGVRCQLESGGQVLTQLKRSNSPSRASRCTSDSETRDSQDSRTQDWKARDWFGHVGNAWGAFRPSSFPCAHQSADSCSYNSRCPAQAYTHLR